MRRLGWMRLACLFLILTVLTALVRVGDTGARSLAARVPDAMSLASEGPQEPAVPQWTEGQVSSLEDSSEGALRAEDASRSGEPRPPAPEREERVQPVEEKAREIPAAEPPVFYRPADPVTSADAGPVCGDLRGAPEGGRIVFPLEQQFFSSYEDTWGAPRAQGGHEGTDLMTPSGVPEYAVTDGTVVPVAGSNADGWNTLGGHAVMVRADYSIGPVEAGDLFYYAHLERKSPLEIGTRVSAGQVVGYAGDTGQGPPGTSGLFPPHLHLGWYDGTGGREEADSGAMNPYPLLEWIKSNGGAVSGGSDARFCEAPRTSPPPSGQDGLSPDLDTGSDNPRPVRATGDVDNDRGNRPPGKKSPRPEPSKKDQNQTSRKPPGGDRPQAHKPDRRGTDQRGATRPQAGEDGHEAPEPEPPEKDPPNNDPPEESPSKPAYSKPAYSRSAPSKESSSETQYGSSTEEQAQPTGKPPLEADLEPESGGKPTPDENKGGDPQKASKGGDPRKASPGDR